ncbi:MAG: hypothetical protein IKR84_03300 [Oscillibacter sp.]|nr:hypothetical protein [Oscillibacter sp.]
MEVEGVGIDLRGGGDAGPGQTATGAEGASRNTSAPKRPYRYSITLPKSCGL